MATLFLTNRECPFRCIYCDLWQNTTRHTVPVGAIPRQIDYALQRLPEATHIKLYNSGNFFDPLAIPREDLPEIAARVARYQTVIVENHPRLCGAACRQFLEELRRNSPPGASRNPAAELEIALGLETVHPNVLPRLNKQMSLEDFRQAAGELKAQEIHVRAFVLLQPPFMPPAEAVDWALRSLEFAFDCGARVATVIPTRGGNGWLETLAARGDFQPPRLSQLEAVLDAALTWRRGRAFVDLWDSGKLTSCADCGPARRSRLHEMNLTQRVLPSIVCHRCSGR